ncbi:MAG: hypothetical protein HOG49_43180 [Candidatus Scalindua sp.]|mgnify:CR=1 FL=1|jgi:hypothetical protein|nr:hypothetical protein [Candidatus Scalindua sp.]
MALTQGAWTQKTVNKMYRATCNVAFTAGETDAYTLKTPTGLDPSKQWSLTVACSATPDGEALPMDIWGGHDDDFVLSGQGSNVVATNGAKLKQMTDDMVLAVTTVEHTFKIDPYLVVADVVTIAAILTGYKIEVPIMPYYAFNLNGGSTLAAENCDFTIMQKRN